MTYLMVLDTLLVLGLTLRLTRLIVADDLGKWYVKGPAALWAANNESDRFGWRTKLWTGLGCPFCVGFWIGVLVLASLAAFGGPGEAPEAWRWVAAAFTLNWVAAHIGARTGDTEED